MTLRRNTRLSIAVMAAVMVATTACTSGTTGEPSPSTDNASAEASPAFPSESVPPGVEKDSVLDLNSTKDMTGVVTTVSFADSPYAAHLPDICTFIPQKTMQQLGVETKKRGFRGTQLVSQACTMFKFDEAGNISYSVTINFFTNNITELTEPGSVVLQNRDVRLTDKISATVSKLPATSPGDPTFRESCQTSWGTFFGSINVDFRTSSPERLDPCSQSVEAATKIVSLMPKSPSQMRPAP
ncbi:hypothetical protein [Williamsia phyllosphaerae]|uniref:DUF3558 domain-containing protein n=1 Tax=Williamsia phyllosphaerae TaxID=885042 RepID=A0ABQ1V4K8_9NOCA|nr:hypothetical protein [Williamsia phyllosphaerae]GGF38147.1 hypothetical protein GCM10007298_37360 [Williamsia phyllosphaerae]